MSKNKFLRTCVSCSKAKSKEELFRFVILNNRVILDFYNKIQSRGFYTCMDLECIKNLNEKVIKRSLKTEKNFEINKMEIIEILLTNFKKKIFSLLHIAKKAGVLTATLTKVKEGIKQGIRFKLVFLATDISENSIKKINSYIKNTIVEDKLFNKEELGLIANKSVVNVIGLKDSKLTEKVIKLIKVRGKFLEGAYTYGYGENS